MNILATFIIHTANILGSFQDPFEFDGDYGEEVNSIRRIVFEQVISKETELKNEITDEENKLLAKEMDLAHGPTLQELVTEELTLELIKKQAILENFSDDELSQILTFLKRYQDKKLFYFLKNVSSDLLSLDKLLRDFASQENENLNLEILSSLEPLKGETQNDLKINLMNQLFTNEYLNLAKQKSSKVKTAIAHLNEEFLRFSIGANSEELEVFSTPAGQVFFYWLYQALHLHLISEDFAEVDRINFVKENFAQSLGDSKVRALSFKEKILTAGTSVLFTQESDSMTKEILLSDGLFLPVDKQNGADGTYIFLRSDVFVEDYELIKIDHYDGFERGRLNVILAKTLLGQKFLLASGHGNSTKAEDGRLQIALVMAKYEELAKKHENLQLIIGIDANTKTEEDVTLLKEHLESLGLTSTNTGPTTIKKRMVTVQHEKACKLAIDEEDYLIVLKEDHGGLFSLNDVTVGFSSERPDLNAPLPNVNNQSDHYPVGAIMSPRAGVLLP